MMLQTSAFRLGKKSLKKPKTSAKVIPYLLNLLGLLEKNRHKRCTLQEVLEHPWFSDFKDI